MLGGQRVTMKAHSSQILTAKVAVATDFKQPFITLQEKGSASPGFVAISDPTQEIFVYSHQNGFFNAFAMAYNYHLHLRLRPDDVWLTIAQGVSAHINHGDNAEKFRRFFVTHEGQMAITVDIDHVGHLGTGDSRLFHWDQGVDMVVEKTSSHVVGAIADVMLCDFSTTSTASKTASQIVFMDAMKRYFKYRMQTRCGIPKVTLEGTLDDWQRLQKKLKQTQELRLEGLEQWLSDLESILQEFVNTYEGKVDETFWSHVMDKQQKFGSGAYTKYSGWLVKFFPYDHAGKRVDSDAQLEAEDFPAGRVSVPFVWDKNGVEIPMKLVSGFLGTVQHNEDGSVAPYIGWAVAKTEPEGDANQQQERYHFEELWI